MCSNLYTKQGPRASRQCAVKQCIASMPKVIFVRLKSCNKHNSVLQLMNRASSETRKCNVCVETRKCNVSVKTRKSNVCVESA